MDRKKFENNIQLLASDIRGQAEDLRNSLFLSFSYTADVFNRYLDIELAKRNSNKTCFSILHNLVVQGGSMTPTEIARKAFRAKHTVTRAIDSLEKDGLVKRGPIRRDRRLVKVTVTEKGLDIVRRNAPSRREISHKAMSCLSKEQAENLRVILKQLRKHLLSVVGDPTGKLITG